MKKILVLISIIVLFASCQDLRLRPAQEFIDEVREEVCPDRRVNIFDVEYNRKGNVITLEGEMNSPSGSDSLTVRLTQEGYTVVNNIRILPDADELEKKTYGVVNRSVANLRVQPSERSEMASQAVLGTPLRVYKKQRSQYYVQTPDGYLGWMEGSAFTHMTANEFQTWLKVDKMVYLEDCGYVYQAPSKDAAPISDITATSMLKAIEPTRNNFVKVAFPDGREGFVDRDAIEHLELFAYRNEPKASSILKQAHSYMGRPYLWGGTSTKMMDCSGLTRIVFLMHGIYLPRDASQQVMVGKTVAEGKEEIDRLKPADLLFFGRIREDGTERITHVGIYIGDGKFIHESGTVEILSFNPEDENYSEYRHNQFIRAKDVINHVGKLGVQFILDNPMFFLQH